MEQRFIEEKIEGIKESNLEKLQKIFPTIMKDGQVDFEELKNMLGEFEETKNEKYEFLWCGKQEAKQAALSGIRGKTFKLIEENSKDIDTTDNMYIEGDNLEALKLLEKNYAGKIKMIYIDPPYNTGNDFVYNDTNAMSEEEVDQKQGNTIDGDKQVNLNKDVYAKNAKEQAMYHSNWLNMMYPRLRIAQELLTDDGVIFISIDDNEQCNLKKLCDELFAEKNFIVEQINITGASQNGEGVKFQKNTESCLVYSKNYETYNPNKIDKAEETLRNLNDSPTPLNTRMDMGYTIYYNEKTGDLVPMKDYDKSKIDTNEENEVYTNDTSLIEQGYVAIRPGKRNDMLNRWRWSFETFEQRKNEIVVKKNTKGYSVFFKQNGYNPSKNILKYSVGTQELKDLFDGKKCFNFSKSSKMIKYLLETSTDKDSIVLDFFSGSATTAHACMQLNSQDNGNRKFIMVQLPEDLEENFKNVSKDEQSNIRETINFLQSIGKPAYLSEVGKERIRRAGEKIKNSLIEAGQSENADKLDIGFKVFKVGETNINWERESYKRAINKQLLQDGKNVIEDGVIGFKDIYSDFVEGAKDIDVVYELMIRYYGVSLTDKIDTLLNIGNRTYSICNTLIVCLEDEVTREMIDKLSEIDCAKIYFRDSSFKGENALELKENLMTRLELQKKNKNNDTYRVEFI